MRPFPAVVLACLLSGPAFAEDYRIGVGDGLRVQVYGEPALSGDVVVTEGCTITLAEVGRVPVCGLTVAEVEQLVTERFADGILVRPTVSVTVTKYHSRRVDVLGEVVRSGPIWLDGPTTLLEVVSAAGGPKAGNVVRAVVTSADGTVATYDLHELAVNPERVLVRAGDTIVLQPGEVVYVEGEIRKPGAVTLVEGLTVTQALALAGGPEAYANVRRILVRRADGAQLRVNVRRVHKGLEADPVLKAGDHVVVPKGVTF